MAYQGQPDYVRAGFQKDLLEPWVRVCEGDEWGEYVYALWYLADCASTVSEQKALTVVGWIRDELSRAWDEHWWGLSDEHEWLIYQAQDRYDEVVAYWRERAVTFKGEAALEEVIAGLPDWFRPSADRPTKPDPERELYERLKAKFET